VNFGARVKSPFANPWAHRAALSSPNFSPKPSCSHWPVRLPGWPLPRVDSAAISVTVPGVPQGFPIDLKVTDAAISPDRKIVADKKVVFGDYFETMRIQLLSGSTCRGDTLWKRAVVNRSFVEAYFPNGTAIGHYLRVPPFDESPEIVGVVADTRENGLNQAPLPSFYWCSSNDTLAPYFLSRTHGDPMNPASLLGCAVGIAVATACSRLLVGMLYGVSRLEPLTYVAVTLAVLFVASIASGIPAAHAARLDPMETLRQDYPVASTFY